LDSCSGVTANPVGNISPTSVFCFHLADVHSALRQGCDHFNLIGGDRRVAVSVLIAAQVKL
jgi:hypothetical protein